MAEAHYYRSPQATVTSARVVLHGVTYAMQNVTSVRLVKLPPRRVFPVFCVGLGVLLTWSGLTRGSGLQSLALSLPLMGIGAALLLLRRPRYVVVLGTAGGEHHALKSSDLQAIRKIVTAVAEAIVKRG